ncbi:MAG: 4Fe-4S binding protein [Tissierellia bacterium]|nr:4Fe-4S binding protein [Tissierellia bacterium]
MEYNRVVAAYFSGTGTTEKVVKDIANKISGNLNIEYTVMDFTPLKSRKKPLVFKDSDIVVFGIFTVAGRVPNLMLPYLETIEGNGAIGIPISTYGNRNVDDCLVELQDILEKAGLKTIAGAYFSCEHSFSNVLAKGRPDEKDLEIAREFADKISEKVKKGDLSKVELPGERPYRFYYQPRDRHENPIDIRKVKPKTNDKCTDCKLCVELCPLGSIDYDNVTNISGICMKCCACIKKCPEGAKYFDDKGYLYHKSELEELYANYNETKYFI